MRSFTDNTGRAWSLSLTIAAVKRVKGLLGVDLLDLSSGTPPLISRLGTDVVLLCDVVYAILQPQADAAGVTDEQFGAALGGEAVEAAVGAFFAELADFFRQIRRTDQSAAIAKQARFVDLAVRRIETRIDRLDLEAEVEAAMAETPGESSTSSPGPSASTPAP